MKSKKMGLAMAVIVGMNAVIGAGIFLIPERLIGTVGPAALISYFFVALAVWAMAFSLARVAQYCSKEGSFYTYVQNWAGKKTGIAVTISYCAGLIIALGLLTRMTGIYLNQIFSNVNPLILSISILIILAISILLGTKILKWGQIILIILTIAPLALITILCLTKANIHNLTPFMPYGVSSIFRATKIIVFGFFGFEAIASLYNFVENPQKTIPKSITLTVVLVSLIYITFVGATFLGIDKNLFLNGKNLAEALYQMFPTYFWLISAIIWGIIITIMGTIHSMIWSVSTLIESVFKMFDFKKINLKVSVILVSSLVGLSCIFLKNLDLFFNLTTLFIVPAIMISILPLLINKIKKDSSLEKINSKEIKQKIDNQKEDKFNQEQSKEIFIQTTCSEKFISLIGILTGMVMIVYAVEGIIKILI